MLNLVKVRLCSNKTQKRYQWKGIDNTFSAGHKIDDVRVETRKFQFLYNDGETYHFMNTDDYNQIELQKSILDAPDLLKEGEHVTVMTNANDGIPLSVDMPTSVDIKGDP